MPKAVHNANGQSALTEKVQLLFDHKTDESKLVGLLLATRLDDDTAFLQLITSHITADWCAWILERQEVVARLLTQILHRAVEIDAVGRTFTVWIDAMGVLLTKSYSLDNAECLSSIQLWLEYCRKCKIMDEALHHLSLCAFDASITNARAQPLEEENDDPLFQDTLQALLDQTTVEMTPDLVLVFVRGATRVIRSGRLPRFYVPLLSAWTEKKQPTSTAAQVLLQTAQKFTVNVFLNENDQAGLRQLILACIVSPTTTTSHDDDLQKLGWSTLLQCVETHSWNWLFLSEAQKNKLGRSTFLCTCVRMAAGECKIQLEQLLVEGGSDDDDQRSQHRLEACSHFLVQIVHCLVALDDDDNADSSECLAGDAILHLQRSLEEALLATAEYLVLSSTKEPSVFSIRLLGVLLTEMDAFGVGRSEATCGWDDQEGSKTPSSPYEGSVVQAVRVALDHGKDDTTHGYLLRGILAVLLSAAAQEDRIALLQAEGVTQDGLPRYLLRVLSASTSFSVLSYACEVVECYADMDAVCEIGRIQQAIADCLERMLGLNPTRELSTTVARLVGTFALLQGEIPPDNEKTSSILHRAYELSGLFGTG